MTLQLLSDPKPGRGVRRFQTGQVNPIQKRTFHVLQKPDNLKSYRQGMTKRIKTVALDTCRQLTWLVTGAYGMGVDYAFTHVHKAPERIKHGPRIGPNPAKAA